MSIPSSLDIQEILTIAHKRKGLVHNNIHINNNIHSGTSSDNNYHAERTMINLIISFGD